jgi:hypothetical protein
MRTQSGNGGPGRARSAVLLLVLALAPGARGAEAYYLMVLGCQRVPNNPDYSHSAAVFVRAVWDRPGAAPRLEVHTISWLPSNLRVRSLALRPECGHNFDLHTTLRWALSNEARVSLWGPYQIDRALYLRALAEEQLLQSGRVLYQANDVGRPTDRVSNCIHAVSGTIEGHRMHVAIPAWGEMASYFLVQRFTPWMIEPCRTHPWVSSALCLDQYPIIYRGADEDPHSGLLRGPVYRLFGGERCLQASYGPPR